ncbi:MAG: hypothetical protein M0P74_04190 [Syntrophales bacterium]|nr:hypothetical protein [Syntrophales bacterium]
MNIKLRFPACAGMTKGYRFSKLSLHGHQADPSCNGVWARVGKFFVRKLWTYAQRWGAKDPTRAANNPGRCDEIDETLHGWANGGLPEGIIRDRAPISTSEKIGALSLKEVS